MVETEFVTGLYEEFKEVEEILDSVLVEELREHDKDISSEGYLFKKYYINSLIAMKRTASSGPCRRRPSFQVQQQVSSRLFHARRQTDRESGRRERNGISNQ